MYLDWIKQHLKPTEVSGEEARLCCPFHEDKTPSFSINTRTGKWFCHGACQSGGGIRLLAKRLTIDPPAKADGAVESVEEAPKVRYIPQELVVGAESRLAGDLGADLRGFLAEKRGITQEACARHHLGLGEDGRLWIPIADHTGGTVNIRRYDWLKTTKSKYLNYQEPGDGKSSARAGGYGAIRLWPADVLRKHVEVLLFEGELDCLLAHSLGLENAITTTGGAGNWSPAFTRALVGKSVVVCYDIDAAGVQGASQIVRELSLFGVSAVAVRLPISEPAHGDFTDYIQQGATKEDFLKLAELAKATGGDQREDPVPSSLRGVSGSGFWGKRVRLRAVAGGKDLVPYQVPSQLGLHCHYSEKSAVCSLCPAKAGQGAAEFPIPDSAPLVCEAVDATDLRVEIAVKKHLGVPHRCPGADIKVIHTRPLWAVRLVNDLDTDEGKEESGEHVARPAYSLVDLRTNLPYDLDALSTTNPKTQHSLLLVLAATGSQTSLETFSIQGKEALLKIWEV